MLAGRRNVGLGRRPAFQCAAGLRFHRKPTFRRLPKRKLVVRVIDKDSRPVLNLNESNFILTEDNEISQPFRCACHAN